MPFTSQLKSTINKIKDDHETSLSALLPVLREVQNELGWLSNESMDEVAEMLSKPPESLKQQTTPVDYEFEGTRIK